MNFTISKNKFYDSLQDVSHAISSTTPLPALKGIKMQVTQDNVMVLTASDNDITIQKTLSNESDEDLNLQVNEAGSIVIESKYLLDIVHKIDSDIVKIELIDERLSTVEAERVLLDYDMSRKKRKEHIDNTAAAIILDTYLRRDENK